MKYRKGNQIRGVGHLAYFLSAGGHVYIRNKFTHQGWLISMQYRVIWNAVKAGVVWEALPNEGSLDGVKEANI